MIDWDSEHSDVFINPCYAPDEQRRFKQLLQVGSSLSSHFWLATSGSTVSKWVGLSKQAILQSAQAVNQHLDAQASDRWIQTLPSFHVGGLGIEARAYVSRSAIFNFREQQPKWEPKRFVDFVNANKGSLTSLVPAQLCDCVQAGLRAPPSLRAVVIGGGGLAPSLYEKAIALGWNILPSYGLTECASQVATAEIGSWVHGRFPPLKILSHMVVVEKEGCLSFKGGSLLTTYIFYRQGQWQLEDPKQEGCFISEDRGHVQGQYLSILGRVDNLIKIGGESVDLNRLEHILQEICLSLQLPQEAALVAYPDERLGHVIHLVVAQFIASQAQTIIKQFHQKVLPFEKIRNLHIVPFIPTTSLLKIKRKELMTMIGIDHIPNN